MVYSQPLDKKNVFLNILKMSPNFRQKNLKISFRLNKDCDKKLISKIGLGVLYDSVYNPFLRNEPFQNNLFRKTLALVSKL